jgi:hypothetical protein
MKNPTLLAFPLVLLFLSFLLQSCEEEAVVMEERNEKIVKDPSQVYLNSSSKCNFF